jgi:hypothetical protein
MDKSGSERPEIPVSMVRSQSAFFALMLHSYHEINRRGEGEERSYVADGASNSRVISIIVRRKPIRSNSR